MYYDIKSDRLYESIMESSTTEFNNILKIVNSLTEKELSSICNGNFKNSPYVIYRKIAYMHNKPISFVEIYVLPGKSDAMITVATNKEYRKSGITKKLLLNAINEVDKSKFNNLVWKCRKDNESSNNLAKSLGFKLNESDETNNYYLLKEV